MATEELAFAYELAPFNILVSFECANSFYLPVHINILPRISWVYIIILLK